AATRAAIRSWQGAVGLEPTGYLTAAQIALLRARTQERWMQWRESEAAAAKAQPPARSRRKPPARARRRPADEPYYVEPRGSRFGRRYIDSDIPGAIPAYRVWN